MVLGMADTHFIIRLQVAKKTNPIRQSEFIRSEAHGCHIYQGKEFPIEELNDLYPKVVEKYLEYEGRGYPPLPHIVKKRYPNMEKARAALAKKREAEKANTPPE